MAEGNPKISRQKTYRGVRIAAPAALLLALLAPTLNRFRYGWVIVHAFADTDPLNRRVVEQMLVGVATRQYHRSLEPVGADVHTRQAFTHARGGTRFKCQLVDRMVPTRTTRTATSRMMAHGHLSGTPRISCWPSTKARIAASLPTMATIAERGSSNAKAERL